MNQTAMEKDKERTMSVTIKRENKGGDLQLRLSLNPFPFAELS